MSVSFIIPAYNERRYIGELIKSIQNLRDLSDYEIIVADNASTDGTAQFVRKNFPNVKVVSHPLKGPAAARNAGAKEASGEYLAFLDADCRAPREWWIKVSDMFRQDKELMLVFGTYHFYDTRNIFEKAVHYLVNVIFLNIQYFLWYKLFRLGSFGMGGDTVVKRTAFERIAGFNEKFSFYGEDADIVNRVSKLGKIKFSSKIWVYSSMRRIRKHGSIKIWWIYFFNTVWTGLFGKDLYKNKHDAR